MASSSARSREVNEIAEFTLQIADLLPLPDKPDTAICNLKSEISLSIVNLAVERFERRLVEEIAGLRVEIARQGAELRTEMAQQTALLRQEIAQNRFQLLKWSFLFWVGQVVAVVGLVGVMLRAVGPAR